MLKFKNISRSISLWALSIFTISADNSPFVIVTSPDYHVEAAFRALFFKPLASNMHYAAEAITLPAPSPHWNIYDLSPQYHFGFDLDFAAHVHCADATVRLNWQHFHSCTTARTATAQTNMIGPFFAIGPDATFYNSAQGNVNFHFDEVNFTYGPNIAWGDYGTSTIFAGISFIHLKQLLNAFYSNPDGSITRDILTPHSFNGAGPQVGFSFLYDMTRHIQVAGKSVVALLAGKTNNHTTFTSVSPEIAFTSVTSPNQQSTSVCTRTIFVPSFEERLGFSYTHECEQYFFTIEFGYQAQIYLDALQSIDMGSEVITPPVTSNSVGVFARTFQRNISNFALIGPYISFNFGF
jgi:hypothetical protein